MKKNQDKANQRIAVATSDDVTKYGGDGAAAEAPADATVETDSAPTDEASEPVKAVKETDLQAECDALRDQLLRSKAELKNLQRRNTTERQQAVRFANADFARDLLVILDDLGRTLDAGREDTDRETLLKSVEMLNDHFRKVLRDYHVTSIDAENKPFDPALHQALIQQPSSEHEPGTVVRVLEAGYMLHDRVLRPVKVAVSAAPPEATASDADDAESEDGGTDEHADL